MKVKDKIKELLGEEKYTTLMNFLSSQKFAEVATKDGGLLVHEGELKEGTPVFIVTTDGNVAPPDGPLELENGDVIEIKDGLVVTITKLKEEEPKEELAASLTPEIEKAIADYVTKVKDELQGQIDELKSMMGEYKKVEPDPAVSELNEKVEKALGDLLAQKNDAGEKFTAIDGKIKVAIELLEAIANLPAAPAKEENFQQKTKREEKLTVLAANLAKLK